MLVCIVFMKESNFILSTYDRDCWQLLCHLLLLLFHQQQKNWVHDNPTGYSGNPKKLIRSRMEDAKYCGRDWIPTGNWPQVRYNPAYNRTTPDNLAQVLRCGSSHPSLPLLYLPTSFTLSLSQLGIFQGHYKVWEWLEHIVFMSTSCMFSSHMPYNTLLLHISRNSTHCITRTWHPLSDVVHLTRRDANFHGIAHVGVNRSR